MRRFYNKALSALGVFVCVAAMSFLLSSASVASDKNTPSEKAAPTTTKQPKQAKTVDNKTIKLQLHWYPQAQFAGYIMAHEKGFFKEQGLDVELVWSKAGDNPINDLSEGKVDFCTAWLTDAIYNKQNGKNICLIAQLMPKSSMMLVAKKSSGIKTPKDIDGKKVGIWGGDFKIPPTAFFKKYNIQPVCINQTSSILPFLCGAVDVASAMYYNEYHKLMEAGVNKDDLVTFSLADEGLDNPEDGVYCREEYLKANPEICAKMLKAIKQGWQYAFDNEDETLDTIVECCKEKKVCTNKNHQKWMLNTIQQLLPMGTEQSKPWGYLSENTYDRVVKMLVNQNLIQAAPSYAQMYKPVDLKVAKSKEADK